MARVTNGWGESQDGVVSGEWEGRKGRERPAGKERRSRVWSRDSSQLAQHSPSFGTESLSPAEIQTASRHNVESSKVIVLAIFRHGNGHL